MICERCSNPNIQLPTQPSRPHPMAKLVAFGKLRPLACGLSDSLAGSRAALEPRAESNRKPARSLLFSKRSVLLVFEVPNRVGQIIFGNQLDRRVDLFRDAFSVELLYECLNSEVSHGFGILRDSSRE